MFRFTIRDVLWLTVVVGLGICLYQDRAQLARLNTQARRSQSELRKLDFNNGRLLETVATQRLALKRYEAAGE